MSLGTYLDVDKFVLSESVLNSDPHFVRWIITMEKAWSSENEFSRKSKEWIGLP